MEQQTKRMNLIRLTFIVAVNMISSGIIMLPGVSGAAASAATLDRIRESGKITFGYRPDPDQLTDLQRYSRQPARPAPYSEAL